MLSGNKYIVNFGMFSSRCKIKDENEVEIFRMKTSFLGGKVRFFRAGDTGTVTAFKYKRVRTEFGLLKGHTIFEVADENETVLGMFKDGSGLICDSTSPVEVMDRYEQVAGKWIFYRNFFKYYEGEKVIGNLYKNDRWGKEYLLDLSEADSTVDSRFVLAVSVYILKRDVGQKYSMMSFEKNRKADWSQGNAMGGGKQVNYCPSCSATYDETWTVCLHCKGKLMQR